MKKILITGANGMLGKSIQKVFSLLNYLIIPTDIHNLNITNLQQIKEVLLLHQPDVVIHCAALTNVDYCETHKEEAYKINAFGTLNLAMICNELNIKLIYISTDYVFDGQSNIPYTEFDKPTGGINIYGQSKYAGEIAVKENCNDYIIARVSWLYGAGGPSFLHTIYNAAKSKSELMIVNDQVGNPTSTIAVAKALNNLIMTNVKGTFHLTCEGSTTWYNYAKEFFDILNISISIIPCTSDRYKRDANRPANSQLEKYMLKFNNLPEMPHWKDSLKEFCNIEFLSN
jgi:dTDP-4-dehydrorhamnose reductase